MCVATAGLALLNMFWLNWPNGNQGNNNQQGFNALSLDIVGIVAILGEGSILRNAQASALSWHHVLPKLIPAPQALIKHEPQKRLPSALGTVVGTYSGNVRFELNFFCQLIHAADEPMKPNEVRMVELHRKHDKDKLHEEAYGVKPYGLLHALSLLGFALSVSLIGLSVHLRDGFGLMATVLLSLTSSIVGFASWWTLKCEEEKPRSDTKSLPHSDVVIFYRDLGAFRIVRCDEEAVARLYFKAEQCVPMLSDHSYRCFALVATSTLIFGLICLSNSHNILQLAFAASYVLLNTLYWASSCLNPLKHHWTHNYTTKPINIVRSDTQSSTRQAPNKESEISQSERTASPTPISRSSTSKLEAGEAGMPAPKRPLPRRASTMLKARRTFSKHFAKEQQEQNRPFTDALWTAIALTASTRWLRLTHIVPDTVAWEQWVEEAGIVAESAWDPEHHRVIVPRLKKDGEWISGIAEPDIKRTVFANKEFTIPAFFAGLLGRERQEVEEEQKVVQLPPWDYQGRLQALLAKNRRKRPSWPTAAVLEAAGLKVQKDPKRVARLAKRWQEKSAQKHHGAPLPGDEAVLDDDEKDEVADGRADSAQAEMPSDQPNEGKQTLITFSENTK